MPGRSVFARPKGLEQGEGEATLGSYTLAPAPAPLEEGGHVHARDGPGVVFGGVANAFCTGRGRRQQQQSCFPFER